MAIKTRPGVEEAKAASTRFTSVYKRELLERPLKVVVAKVEVAEVAVIKPLKVWLPPQVKLVEVLTLKVGVPVAEVILMPKPALAWRTPVFSIEGVPVAELMLIPGPWLKEPTPLKTRDGVPVAEVRPR